MYILYLQQRRIEPQQLHSLKYLREFIFQKILALCLQHGFQGIRADEISDSASVVDYPVSCQLLVRAHYRVRVDPDVSAVLAHRRDALVRPQRSAEDLLAYRVADLQVYRFVAVEFDIIVILRRGVAPT